MKTSFARCLLCFAFAAGPALAADQFINVLTGGTSGVYYPLGVALANSIGKAIPAAKTSVQTASAQDTDPTIVIGYQRGLAYLPVILMEQQHLFEKH